MSVNTSAMRKMPTFENFQPLFRLECNTMRAQLSKQGRQMFFTAFLDGKAHSSLLENITRQKQNDIFFFKRAARGSEAKLQQKQEFTQNSFHVQLLTGASPRLEG